MPPDPLEVVGPESPPGARVTQNSRYTTDGLEMVMTSSSRIAITSLQLAQFAPHTCGTKTATTCGMKAATRVSKHCQNYPGIPYYAHTTVYNIYDLA